MEAIYGEAPSLLQDLNATSLVFPPKILGEKLCSYQTYTECSTLRSGHFILLHPTKIFLLMSISVGAECQFTYCNWEIGTLSGLYWEACWLGAVLFNCKFVMYIILEFFNGRFRFTHQNVDPAIFAEEPLLVQLKRMEEVSLSGATGTDGNEEIWLDPEEPSH
ncbi:conserved hypothetical protein [Ricinus communis]|uniref:Uncharacterized protein n=1 Tax=Ricinus communis TaxID=3988 RepID=B9RM19_RICCO|nr:conserved hypothetical protein [Ricinus communis]